MKRLNCVVPHYRITVKISRLFLHRLSFGMLFASVVKSGTTQEQLKAKLYTRDMDENINLANPDFEPTDEQLQELMRQAFAHIPKQNEERLRLLREQILQGRIELLKQLRAEKVQTA